MRSTQRRSAQDLNKPRRARPLGSQLLILQPMFAVLLLAILWAIIFAQIDREHDQALDRARDDCVAWTQSFEERALRILNQVDQTSLYLKFEYEESGRNTHLQQLLTTPGTLPRDIPLRIALVDAHGQVIEDTEPGIVANLAQRDFFLIHANSDTPNLYIGRMEQLDNTLLWSVPMTRRLNDEHGNFAGVLLIAMDPGQFSKDFKLGNLAGMSSLTIIGTDGVFRARRVGANQVYGGTLDISQWPKSQPAPAVTIFTAESPTDHLRRIYSYRRLEHFPLVAVVGVEEQEALSSFQWSRAIYLWAASVVSMLIIGSTAILMLQATRMRRSAEAVRMAQTAFKSAAEDGLDAFFVLRRVRNAKQLDFEFIEANSRAARLFSMAREQLVGERLSKLLPESQRAQRLASYARAEATGAVTEEEFSTEGENQRLYWMRQQIIPLAEGLAVRLRNITQDKDEQIANRNDRNFLRSLIDHLPLLIYVRDVRNWYDRKTIIFNTAAEVISGYKASDVLMKPSDQVFPERIQKLVDNFERRMIANPMVYDVSEIPLPRADGVMRSMHMISVPLFDDDNKIEYILGIAEDVTRKRQQELELRTKQAELTAANDASPLGLFHVDAHGQCTYVNRTYEEISGIERGAALGDGWVKAVHPEDRIKVFQTWHKCNQDGKPYQGQYRFLHSDGKVVWVSVKTAPVIIDGTAVGHVGSVDDITTRRNAEQALRLSEARMRTITDTLPAMVAFVGADERYRFNNIAYEAVYGIRRDKLRGMHVREVLGEVAYAKVKPQIDRALRGEKVTFQLESEHTGQYHCAELSYIPQWDEDHLEIVGFHVMNQDITAQKLEERRLLQLAQIDSLTGFANRAGFKQKLTDALTRNFNHRNLMGLLFIDLDRFKPVNDQYGHPVGDQLLKKFAERLGHALRASDSIARLGGDEFTVIMEDVPKTTHAEQVAAKIVQIMQEPFDLDGIIVNISVSIGVAFCHSGSCDATTLIKRADDMLYKAKEAGRNTYRVSLTDTEPS